MRFVPESEAEGAPKPKSRRAATARRAASTAGRASSTAARDDVAEVTPTSREDAVAAAEAVLLKKLRSRARSVSEARSLIAPGLTDEQTQELLTRFERLGYLDDASLAEQLVRAGTERKGQGRRAVAQTLAARGVPAAVAAAALASLDDDDEDRALEYARGKMRVGGVDREVAVRRVAGQLARRGYPSHIALNAARTAWDELATD